MNSQTTKTKPRKIVLEVRGYSRGRQFIDKKISRVRVSGGSYRPATDPDFERALAWLMANGYELEQKVGPGHRMGTATARYIYTLPGPTGDIETALPFQRSRIRDRVFKSEAV